MRILLTFLLFLTFISITGCTDDLRYPTAPTQATPGISGVVFHWTAPTEGSAVDHYVVDMLINADHATVWTPYAVVVVPIKAGDFVAVRVAGVDAFGRQGPWSEWSETYMAPKIPNLEDPYDGRA